VPAQHLRGTPPLKSYLDLHAYEVTEVSVYQTAHRCTPESSPRNSGKPFPGVEIVIDSDGEIWIGGPQVARGYLGRPELTTTKFLTGDALPDGLDRNVRWFRTGDLGKWVDGELEVCLLLGSWSRL